MYTLHMHSEPGWSKKFDSLEALTEEVSERTCQLCKDSYGRDLEGMRCSDCGCEYSIEGIDLDGPETML